MTRISGVGVDEVNVTGDLGQPRKQGVAVAVAAAVGRLTPARKDECHHDGEPKCLGQWICECLVVSQGVAPRSVPIGGGPVV